MVLIVKSSGIKYSNLYAMMFILDIKYRFSCSESNICDALLDLVLVVRFKRPFKNDVTRVRGERGTQNC